MEVYILLVHWFSVLYFKSCDIKSCDNQSCIESLKLFSEILLKSQQYIYRINIILWHLVGRVGTYNHEVWDSAY